MWHKSKTKRTKMMIEKKRKKAKAKANVKKSSYELVDKVSDMIVPDAWGSSSHKAIKM